ncbi:MAG: hypothetical protein KGJ45_00420 [Elusimicrobia bacterium]|nr:hypothetical protein [Elusimicrobiota bacterium]
MKRGEPEIVFLDRKGNTRFHVSLAKDGSPYLSLRGDRAGLEISSEKGGKFFDVVISSSKAKGSPVMFMGDDAAGAQVVLGLASGQVPVLYLVNEGQRHAGPSQTEVALGASGPAHGGGHIYVGAPKSQAVKDKTGQSAITVFDTNGKLLWQSPR